MKKIVHRMDSPAREPGQSTFMITLADNVVLFPRMKVKRDPIRHASKGGGPDGLKEELLTKPFAAEGTAELPGLE